MRFFSDFGEAQNEIARDLKELGIPVHTDTYQNKDIRDDPNFLSHELQNYMYTVTDPDYTMIGGVHEEWVAQEWADRLAGELNPGKAWRLREDVWRQFLTGLEASRRFDYTYSQRMGGKHIQRVIEEINEHPESRQLYLPVWSEVDERRRGLKRVPCSLGYWFNLRKGRLNLTYMMRSCDFFTHYPNDVALAAMLLRYVADETGYDVGSFTHYIGAFHVFEKDVSHVF